MENMQTELLRISADGTLTSPKWLLLAMQVKKQFN